MSKLARYASFEYLCYGSTVVDRLRCQNLTTMYVRFWHLKSITVLNRLNKIICFSHRSVFQYMSIFILNHIFYVFSSTRRHDLLARFMLLCGLNLQPGSHSTKYIVRWSWNVTVPFLTMSLSPQSGTAMVISSNYVSLTLPQNADENPQFLTRHG